MMVAEVLALIAFLAALAWVGYEILTYRRAYSTRRLMRIDAQFRPLAAAQAGSPRRVTDTDTLRRKLNRGTGAAQATAMERLGALLERAGFAGKPALILAASLGGILLAGLGGFIFGGREPLAVAAGAGAALSGLLLWLRWRIAFRQRAILQGFADAIEAMVRSLRAGLPLGDCVRQLAREMPSPIREVFARIAEEIGVGVPLDQAAVRAAARTGLAEMRFFAIVLAIQQQTGGNLAESLTNLADLLRARKRLRDRIQALSSEARASATIIGAMPFLVAGLLWLANPAYLDPLLHKSTGLMLLTGGLGWMALGILVMRRMIDLRL